METGNAAHLNAQLCQDSKTADGVVETVSIERSAIHGWLSDPRRLRRGRVTANDELAKLLVWLAARRSNWNPKVCLSMCGARAVATSVQQQIATAQSELRRRRARGAIEFEFLPETQ